MIFDLIISMFELLISEISDCKCCFLRKENFVSSVECSCNHLKYLSCLAAAGGVSVALEHGEATGCDVYQPHRHNFRFCLTRPVFRSLLQ